MSEHVINVRVDDKIATQTNGVEYVCGNSDFIVNFEFDEEWNQHEYKTARFVTDAGEHQDVIFSGDQCEVPILSNTYNVYVGVFAGNLYTSTPAHITALRSILCGTGDKPAVPDEDAYDTVMSALNEGVTRSENAAERAEEAVDKAVGGGIVIVRVWYENGERKISHTWDDISEEKRKGKPVFAATTDVTYLCYGQEGTDFVFAALEYTPYGEAKGLHAKRLVIHKNNTADITKMDVDLLQGGIDEEQLDQAVRDALQEAKDSGEFDGANGISPTIKVTAIDGGHRVVITDKNGTQSFEVMDGTDAVPLLPVGYVDGELMWLTETPITLAMLFEVTELEQIVSLKLGVMDEKGASISVYGLSTINVGDATGENLSAGYALFANGTNQIIRMAYDGTLTFVSTSGEGGTSFTTDETLTLVNGILSVNTADEAEMDNTLPITSSAVYTAVGNINALLETI